MTCLGIHKMRRSPRGLLEAGVTDAIASARPFRERIAAIDPHGCRRRICSIASYWSTRSSRACCGLEVEKGWGQDPDSYSSGITNTAYIMIKRTFAPPRSALRKLVAAEADAGGAGRGAEEPGQSAAHHTQIALEQIDGNRTFFEDAVASAFPEVKDPALLAEFTQANGAVAAALGDYTEVAAG